MNPKINIDLNKIKHNASILSEKAKQYGIDIAAVTKVFCGNTKIANALVDAGVKYLADSRIENLIKMREIPLPKILLRLPMINQASEVVNYADISLNSEIETIKALNKSAELLNKIHKIILMVDLGDLREGIFTHNSLEEFQTILEDLISLKNIQIIGIGTNLTCYGGVIPNEQNLSQLLGLGKIIEQELNIKLEIISGGNSSSIYLFDENKMPKGINHLRLGESILLGVETAYGNEIPNTYQDAFTLVAEIIELKDKPTLPIGQIGRDAFGNIPTFEDRGIRKRAILAIGKQDIANYSIQPLDKNIQILGGSSDHLIIDVTDSDKNYKVGDEISFSLGYGALLALMTSEYVYKNFI